MDEFKICYHLLFLPLFSECTEPSHCNDPNKNICSSTTNQCECNDGFVLDQGKCVCMTNNQFVNSEGKCKACPAGEEPALDGKSCMICDAGKISTNGICMECTDSTKVPNIDMTECVGKLKLIS